MKYRFLCVVAALAALSACDRSPEGSLSTQAPAVASSATTATPPAGATAGSLGDTVVLGNVHLNFPNRVRSSKDVIAADGAVTHRKDVEYIGLDQNALDAALRKAVVDKGYTLAGPSEREGVFRYLVMSGKERVGQIAVSPVGPALKIKLGAPGATGLALFIWQDTKPAN
jgi:hypothetical protein